MHGVQPLELRNVLNTYARRGVFRSLSETRSSAGVTFSFQWLWNAPFTMTLEPKGALVFKSVLRGVERGSAIENGVKQFLHDCQSEERVEHRRLDRRSVGVSYSNRGSAGTLRFRIRDGDMENGAKKAVQVVNEIFVDYLSAHYPSYLVEHFRVSED